MAVKKPKQQAIRDKTSNPTIFNDKFFDEEDEDEPEDEDEDEDEDDIPEINDDDVFDKDLIRIIRKRYPKSNFLRWLSSKRNRSSS